MTDNPARGIAIAGPVKLSAAIQNIGAPTAIEVVDAQTADKGVSPFGSYQLPTAVIALKQGAGRLIRDAHDRGVLVLCDPRVRTRGYGKTFLKSLPPMPIVEDLAAVRAFFAPQAAASNAVKAQSIG